MLSVILVLEALAFLVVLRLLAIAPRGRGPAVKRDKNDNDNNNKTATTASLAVFLGSGGHTAEMRALLASVDRQRYTPRTYVYCAGDDMSLRAVADFEASTEVPGSAGAGARNPDYSLLSLPRARAVGEGKLSTLVSASKTFAVALWHVFALPTMARPRAPWADVLILNGPGTAVVLVAAVYIRRILGLSYTRIIYVESFARVKSLSLSGKLLKPFVDTFVVQWPDLAGENVPSADIKVKMVNKGEQFEGSFIPGTTYRGWLV